MDIEKLNEQIDNIYSDKEKINKFTKEDWKNPDKIKEFIKFKRFLESVPAVYSLSELLEIHAYVVENNLEQSKELEEQLKEQLKQTVYLTEIQKILQEQLKEQSIHLKEQSIHLKEYKEKCKQNIQDMLTEIRAITTDSSYKIIEDLVDRQFNID